MTRENVTHRTVLMQNMMIVVIYFPSLYLLLFLFIIFLFPYYINIFPMTLRQFSQTFYFFPQRIGIGCAAATFICPFTLAIY